MKNTKKKKRPIWIWVISIFYFLSAGYTLLSFYLIYTGTITLTPAMQAYFDSLSTFDYSITILTGTANFFGAITLFLLRKQAFYLFSGALCAGILLTISHTICKGWATAIGGSGLIGMLISWGIALAVITYSKKLIKRGLIT